MAAAGLSAAGLRKSRWEDLTPRDVLLTWTPWSGSARERYLLEHKRRGGLVLVGENAYYMPDGVRRWTFGIDGTNGRGRHLPRQCEPRPDPEGPFRLLPWRTDGDHILICGQRGVRADSPTISCDPGWPDRVIPAIMSVVSRPIWYRPHPGRQLAMPSHDFKGRVKVVPCSVPLSEQLEGAWACVTYCSTAIVEAIFRGVPSFFTGPFSIAEPMASRDLSRIDNPHLPDREQWADNIWGWQWTDEEVSSGAPFRPLLSSR